MKTECRFRFTVRYNHRLPTTILSFIQLYWIVVILIIVKSTILLTTTITVPLRYDGSIIVVPVVNSFIITGTVPSSTKSYHHHKSNSRYNNNLISKSKSNLLSRSNNRIDHNNNPDEIITITTSNHHYQEEPQPLKHDKVESSRRRTIVKKAISVTTAVLFGSSLANTINANAASTITETAALTTTPTTPATITADEAVVTQKVFFDVRISRADGTFYVRDEENNNKEESIVTSDDGTLSYSPNLVFTGRLVIGLFGKNAPTHVEKFLSYIIPPGSGNPDDVSYLFDENPYPNYGRSVFTKFDDGTGVVTAGVIPALELTELNGYTVLKYGGRILPATLWLEKSSSLQSSTSSTTPQTPVPKIRHIGKGLLTHRILDVTPTFGITTRNDTRSYDGNHIVFGKILSDTTSNEFLSRITSIPTYSMDRPSSAGITNTGNGNNNNNNNYPQGITAADQLVEDAATKIYAAQREFFRSAAKNLGDTRVSKIYEGKFLRRVEVTQVGLL